MNANETKMAQKLTHIGHHTAFFKQLKPILHSQLIKDNKSKMEKKIKRQYQQPD